MSFLFCIIFLQDNFIFYYYLFISLVYLVFIFKGKKEIYRTKKCIYSQVRKYSETDWVFVLLPLYTTTMDLK